MSENSDEREKVKHEFRSKLADLAWRAGFLTYLTSEEQERTRKLIEELTTIFEEDKHRFLDALGRGMCESIAKLPPVK